MSNPGLLLSPSAAQVLRLVCEFLEQELLPAQSDAKLRLRARVAANLLRGVGRELEMLDSLEVDADGNALPPGMIAQVGTLRAFAGELLGGQQQLTDPKVFDIAMRHVQAKLAIVTGEDRNATS
jgi:hypothetical protein